MLYLALQILQARKLSLSVDEWKASRLFISLLLSCVRDLWNKILVDIKDTVNVDLYRYPLIMNRRLLMVGNILSVKIILKTRGSLYII